MSRSQNETYTGVGGYIKLTPDHPKGAGPLRSDVDLWPGISVDELRGRYRVPGVAAAVVDAGTVEVAMWVPPRPATEHRSRF
jgi:hypothetical protein